MVQLPRWFRGDERGQALLEYAILVALVGACLVVILGLVGRAAHGAYERSSETLAKAPPGYVGGGGGALVGSLGGGHGEPRPSVPPGDSLASGDPDDSTGVTRTAAR